MPRLSFPVQAQTWRQLKDALQKLIEDSPETAQHLAPMREELEQALAETQARKGRLMTLKGETRLETRLFREAIARGQAVESRLRSALKSLHGPASPKLVRYGIKPLPGPKHPPPAAPEGAPGVPEAAASGDPAAGSGPTPEPAREALPEEGNGGAPQS
jgi:hypothetical protein